jgi:hypothetical protein
VGMGASSPIEGGVSIALGRAGVTSAEPEFGTRMPC